MPSPRPANDAELAKAASQLGAALGRSKAFLGAALGCLLGAELVLGAKGPAALPPALAWMLMAWAAAATWLWQSNWHRVLVWILAVDARLGQGKGRALLGWGPGQAAVTPMDPSLPGLGQGLRACSGKSQAADLSALAGPGLGAWLGPLLLGVSACLPLPPFLRLAGLSLALLGALGAWSLGAMMKKG